MVKETEAKKLEVKGKKGRKEKTDDCREEKV
jgi:hypothetical protein